ncbi:MAG: hypothetical protein J6S61_04965 [Elusimicrobiaceae bacterium]|nr:hypothetical protein [Elusimicrobiaceae bacterium]
MDFFKRNSGKIALLAIIAFFTLPFIYGDEDEEDFSPFAVKSGLSYQANPISKLVNKIASFYEFSNSAPKMDNSKKSGTDLIKEKVSFNKDNPFGRQAENKTQSQNNTLVASSKKVRNLNSSITDSKRTTSSYSTKPFDNAYVNSYTAKANDPVKGYIQVNGKDYELIEDATGEKYVVTPKGHIPYKELTKRMVSQQEFNAKKQSTGLDDIEVLRSLQQEKAKQAYIGGKNSRNYQNDVTSYRHGTTSNMGGVNYIHVSTDDKGFDDNALSDAYANLKGVNLKIDTSSASARSGGVVSRGSVVRGSFSGNSEDKQSGNLAPKSIVTEAKEQAREEFLNRKQRKSNKQIQNMQEEAEGMPREEKIYLPEIKSLGKGESGYEINNESSAQGEVLFIETDDANNIYSREWGVPTKVEISGNQVSGIILPKVVNTVLQTPNLENNNIANAGIIIENTKKINGTIGVIRDMTYGLPDNVKVYVSSGDKPSLELIQNVMKINTPNGEVNFITEDRKKANIVLSGPILTPKSFERFLNDFAMQLQQIHDSHTDGMPS